MRVLISGFTEFGDNKVNPSRLLAEQVNACSGHDVDWSGADVRGVVLPVEFEVGFQRLRDEIGLFRPDTVLSFGLAAGRRTIDLERFAVNWRESSSMGASVVAGELLPDCPLALASTLPIESIFDKAKGAGLPMGISHSAGTYVCNDVFYRMQKHFLRSRVRSGFIHVPPIGTDCTLDQLVQFASLAIGVLKDRR